MSDASVTFAGADLGVDATTDNQRANFLKLFSGEVLTAFEKTTVTLDKHYVRTITQGKSAQFIVMGRMPSAAYHTPGAEITGQDVNKTEKVLSIDKLLISHTFIDDLDDAMAHFDVRSRYSAMMGQKLAETFDNHVMREVLIGAGTVGSLKETISDETGSSYALDNDNLDSSTDADNIAAWAAGLFGWAANLDNNFVEADGRYCVLKPASYLGLVQAVGTSGMSVIHRDYGGEGSYADGKVLKIGGIELVKSPMVPTANYSGETYHAIDCSDTKAVCFTKDAVGTIKLLDISVQSQWDIRRQGTLMVARYAMGHGYLRPECCGRFYTTP